MFVVFFSILKWVHEKYNYWSETRDWPAYLRLGMVWAHADKLFRILISTGAGSLWLHEPFSQLHYRLPYEVFERNQQTWFDIAHPRRMQRLSFLFAGLAYSLQRGAEAVLGDALRARLLEEAFPVIEGVPVPALRLLVDSGRADNLLGSFLDSDHGEQITLLLGSDVAMVFSHTSLISCRSSNHYAPRYSG